MLNNCYVSYCGIVPAEFILITLDKEYFPVESLKTLVKIGSLQNEN